MMKYLTDKLSNLVANLGTDRDKASASYYSPVVVNDYELMNAYRGAWMPRKIVDIPALDACRRWRDWQADNSDISKIEALEKHLGVQTKILAALKKARLFGGAAVYISTGEFDTSKPIPENAKIRHLTVITRRKLTAGELELDPDSPQYMKPAFYTVANTHQRIHPSRLVIFVGGELPDEELAVGDEYGWGDSVLNPVMDSIKHADSTLANVASLVFEAKVDVIKIPDFMSGLEDPEYEKLVLNRLRLAAQSKGNNGMLLLDALEDYEQKSANFSSLRDILDNLLQVVSGSADIPITRFLGTTPGGLQSTGESDLRNYYDTVSSSQELVMRPAMAVLDRLIIRNALGSEPEDVWYKWSSLWQTTDKEASEIGASMGAMIKGLAETNLFHPEALARAAVTALTERGVLTGLEQAVADIGSPEEGIDEEGGALLPGEQNE